MAVPIEPSLVNRADENEANEGHAGTERNGDDRGGGQVHSLFTRSSIGTPPLDQPEKSKLPPPRNGSARGCACGEQMIVLDKQFVANTVVYTSVADKRIRSIWGK
jgi:hypothetical protein